MPISDRGVQRRYAFWRDEVAPAGYFSALSEMYDTDQNSEEYPSVGAAPPMQARTGESNLARVREYTFTITNQLFDTGIEIPKRYILQDKTAQIDTLLMDLAQQSELHKNALLANLINVGQATASGFDGQFFFDTDHALGDSGAQSNDIGAAASTATAPTPEEMANGILAGVQQITGFLNDRGEPINEGARSFHVMGRHTMMAALAQAMSNRLVSSGGSGNVDNPIASLDSVSFSYSATPRITDTDGIYVFRTDAPRKPFIFQEQSEWDEGLQVLGRGSDHWVKQNQMLAKSEVYRNLGYGSWETACLVTFS